jgi:uncharacterized protein (UPF0264 family)
VEQALSIKQPWAALVVNGFKTIEIRRWSTRYRGRVLIHAGRVPDRRPQTWARLPRGLDLCAQLGGGIVGEARLVDCRAYTTSEAFAADRQLHLNDPSWFQPPVMYGFVFKDTKPLPFHRFSGSLYFFDVDEARPGTSRRPAGLLVSVRNAEEAAAALEGGAALIDVKEPRQGPLGRASERVIAEVLSCVGSQRPVSAALGELAEIESVPEVSGLTYVKCGLANLNHSKRWQRRVLKLRERLARQSRAPQLVSVAYVDWKNASAPPWFDVAQFALRRPGEVLLLDTFDKKRRSGSILRKPQTLLDWLTVDEVRRLCQRCHEAGVHIALAGSLRVQQILQILDCQPTWFALRGAVCEANKRDGDVHVLKVLDLAELLKWPVH